MLLSQGIDLELRTTVVKGKAGDFDKIAEIAYSRGVKLGVFDYISPGRDDFRFKTDGERLSPSELVDYLKHFDGYLASKEKPGIGCIKENEKISSAKQLEKNENTASTNVQVMNWATLPESPVSPRTMLNMAIAFLLGLMLSHEIIFIKEYLDNTVKTESDIQRLLSISIIGIIPQYR